MENKYAKDPVKYFSYPYYINIFDNKKFEKYYQKYDQIIIYGSALFNELKYIFEQNLLDTTTLSFLDIGCSIGTYSFLCSEFNAKYITGIDQDKEHIDICKKTKKLYNFKNIDFYCVDFFNFIKNKTYDVLMLLHIPLGTISQEYTLEEQFEMRDILLQTNFKYLIVTDVLLNSKKENFYKTIMSKYLNTIYSNKYNYQNKIIIYKNNGGNY